MSFQHKYLKYKKKYLDLLEKKYNNQFGGSVNNGITILPSLDLMKPVIFPLMSNKQIGLKRSSYSTPLNMEEYEFSQSVRLVPYQTYNPIDLRGFFTHGIKNNIETFINILKDKIILPRNKISSLLHTGTASASINLDLVSLATITVKEAIYYRIYGEKGITFISNKIDSRLLNINHANMQNEFFINQLNLDKTTLLLDEKLKTLKIKDIPMLDESLNIYSLSYKDTIKNKIIFLIDEFSY
jgi:hypothetical protein